MPRHLVLALALPLAAAADWPRFRGPNGAGVADDPAVPLTWSATANVLWRAEVPGAGHSSPVVAAGRVVVQTATADGAGRSVHAFDPATGNPLWTRTVPARAAHIHKKNSLASATPAVDAGRVFALVWDGQGVSLHAYGLDGKDLWTTALGGFESDHGLGTSPVAFGGKVFVNLDQSDPGRSEMLAFDAATGAKVWGRPRKTFRACSAAPLVRDLGGGRAEVVVASTAGVTGYDPDTGAVNWNWDWKFDGQPLRTVGSPVLAGDVVVAVAGDGGGSRSMVALAPGPAPKLLWEKRKDTPYVPGPVAHAGHLYWVTDGGLAACAEVTTGKLVWAERAFPNLSKGTYVHSSPVLVNGHVVAAAETGRAVVFKASPAGYEVVAQNDLGEVVAATPAVAGGRLFVRGHAHLYCIGK